jgi:hypothetical protein
VPGDRRAPIMANDHGPLFLERIQYADHVADEMEKRILIDAGGAIALPVAAHVRGYGVKSGFGQRLHLMAP